MSCEKGRFVSIIHNDLRNLTPKILIEICKDTEIEPKVTPVTREELDRRTSSTMNKVRLASRVRRFWEREQ